MGDPDSSRHHAEKGNNESKWNDRRGRRVQTQLSRRKLQCCWMSNACLASPFSQKPHVRLSAYALTSTTSLHTMAPRALERRSSSSCFFCCHCHMAIWPAHQWLWTRKTASVKSNFRLVRSTLVSQAGNNDNEFCKPWLKSKLQASSFIIVNNFSESLLLPVAKESPARAYQDPHAFGRGSTKAPHLGRAHAEPARSLRTSTKPIIVAEKLH